MSSQEHDAEHEQILHEVLSEPPTQSRRRGSSKALLVALAIIILSAMTLWAVPAGIFAPTARPAKVPGIDEVLPAGTTIPQRPAQDSSITTYLNTTSTVKLVAARVVSATCSNPDARCAADALYYFVRDNIAYLNDPINEYYELPEETLLAGAADCDGQAILLASLLRAVGIQTRFHYTPRHVAVEARLPTKSILDRASVNAWELYDPTCKSCRAGTAPTR